MPEPSFVFSLCAGSKEGCKETPTKSNMVYINGLHGSYKHYYVYMGPQSHEKQDIEQG